LGCDATLKVLTPEEWRQVHDLWDLVADAASRAAEALDALDEA
jgi:hypothetical protein